MLSNLRRDRPLARLVACAALLMLPLAPWAASVRADTTATWAGNVVAVSDSQITVNHKQTGTTAQKTRRFLIGDDFQGVWTSQGGKKKTLSALKPGTLVQVTYYTDVIQHVDHARKITIVNGFNLNINLMQTPAAAPVPSPPGG
jgi:hypothetical protein